MKVKSVKKKSQSVVDFGPLVVASSSSSARKKCIRNAVESEMRWQHKWNKIKTTYNNNSNNNIKTNARAKTANEPKDAGEIPTATELRQRQRQGRLLGGGRDIVSWATLSHDLVTLHWIAHAICEFCDCFCLQRSRGAHNQEIFEIHFQERAQQRTGDNRRRRNATNRPNESPRHNNNAHECASVSARLAYTLQAICEGGCSYRYQRGFSNGCRVLQDYSKHIYTN